MIRRLIAWFERQTARLVRGYQFVNDVLYYFQRGHRFQDAVNMAHRVVK